MKAPVGSRCNLSFGGGNIFVAGSFSCTCLYLCAVENAEAFICDWSSAKLLIVPCSVSAAFDRSEGHHSPSRVNENWMLVIDSTSGRAFDVQIWSKGKYLVPTYLLTRKQEEWRTRARKTPCHT